RYRVRGGPERTPAHSSRFALPAPPQSVPDDRLKELARPLRLRILEELRRWSLLHHLALVKHDDTVRDFAREAHLVRHHEHRHVRRRGKSPNHLLHFPDQLG